MNVTPQIAENDIVVLNVRPTITSEDRQVVDPNSELRQNDTNLVR
jgi:general secretion pathway protein D